MVYYLSYCKTKEVAAKNKWLSNSDDEIEQDDTVHYDIVNNNTENLKSMIADLQTENEQLKADKSKDVIIANLQKQIKALKKKEKHIFDDILL